jgi:NitT/TauT family transport system permease protein
MPEHVRGRDPVLRKQEVRERAISTLTHAGAAPAPRVDTPLAADATRRGLAARVHLGVWLPPLVLLGILAFGWDEYAHHTRFVIPTLGAIYRAFTSDPGQYGKGALITLSEVAIGGTSGILLAFATSLVLAEVPVLERALMPGIVVLLVAPLVVIAPILVVIFGFGPMPKYFIAGLLVFPAMVINTLAGFRNLDPRALDVLITVDASPWEKFRHLTLRSSLPFVFVGLRVALPISVVGATVAELAAPGASKGLGGLISNAQEGANLPIMWASILCLIVLGLCMIGLWYALRRRFLWWDNEAALARRGGR